MYNSSDVAEQIKTLAKKRCVSIKKLLEDVGLGFNTMSNMRTSMPKADNLARIADYLDCSVDYLLGRTEAQKKAAESDEQTQQLNDIFIRLNDDGRAKLLEQAVMMEKSGLYSDNVLPFAARTTNDTIELVTDINDTEVPPPDTTI